MALATLLTTMDSSSAIILYPAVATAFQVDASVAAWVGLAYLLGSTSLLFAMGYVGDAMGRERIFLLGLGTFTAGLGLVGLAQNIPQLILWRALQGVGAAMILPAETAILTAVFPSRERGRAFGLLGAVVGLGLASGPALGGLALQYLDWRAVFYTRVPLSLLTTLLAWRLLRRQGRQPERLQLDVAGSLLFLCFLGSFLFAVNQAGRLGPGSPLVLGTALLSLVALPLFGLREARASRPIVDLRLIRHPAMLRGQMALLAHFQAWAAATFLMAFFMVQGMGYGTAKAGLILAVFSVVRSLASPATGWLADHATPRLLMSLGLAVMASGLVLLSRLGTGVTPWQIVGILAFASFGSALFDPANVSSVMGAVPRERLGMAGASIATGRQIGLSLGTALAGTLLVARQSHYLAAASQGSPPGAITADTALIRAAGDALIVSAAICALGVLPLVLGKRSSSRTVPARRPERER